MCLVPSVALLLLITSSHSKVVMISALKWEFFFSGFTLTLCSIVSKSSKHLLGLGEGRLGRVVIV